MAFSPATPQQRLNTSQSEGGLSSASRMSDRRREKLVMLKQREELKDALTAKFKGRFGRNAQRGVDEVTVATEDIQDEVANFTATAAVTEANLGRLERRLQNRALGKGTLPPDAMSVSAYSTGSRLSRSQSLTHAGAGMLRVENGAYDWSRLDEYAAYLHEQDVLRQKHGVQALQKKLRKDLDSQVQERQARKTEHSAEDRKYHANMMVELERWKNTERARADERLMKLQREKKDRDDQLHYERSLKEQAARRKKEEEENLVEKIVTEMEAEQKRFERKKEESKRAMRKVFEENMEDQKKRHQLKLEQQEKDANAMREYNRILDEQEEQRAEEMQQRMDRQKSLMEKLQANVEKQAKDAGDNDALRAAKQQDEMDRHFAEAERVKQQRLKQLRMETQAYLCKQMAEKDQKKQEERELQDIQARILERDTEEYNQIEKEKVINRRLQHWEHRKEVENQIEARSQVRLPEMSEAEIKMNRQLLEMVDKTLRVRDERLAVAAKEREEAEDV